LHPLPVKSLPANPWGLYEMHGNVLEWCADGMPDGGGYRRYPRQATDEVLVDPVQVGGDGAKERRIVRGGSFRAGASACRSSARLAFARGRHYFYVGFRFAILAHASG
jgi:formylglycine-generating enzyme required for sulfatase activity